MLECYLLLVLQLFLPWGARIVKPRAMFGRPRRGTIWRQTGAYTFCLWSCFLQAVASGLRRPSLSISTCHGAADKLWTTIFEKKRVIPPFRDTEEALEAGLPETLSKKRDWDHTWAWEHQNACMRTIRKQAQGRMGSRCLGFLSCQQGRSPATQYATQWHFLK